MVADEDMVYRARCHPRDVEAGEGAERAIVRRAAGRAAVAERALARFDDRGIALARRRAVEIAHQHRRLARLALAVDPAAAMTRAFLDRKRRVSGKSVAVRVDLRRRRVIKKKNKETLT